MNHQGAWLVVHEVVAHALGWSQPRAVQGFHKPTELAPCLQCKTHRLVSSKPLFNSIRLSTRRRRQIDTWHQVVKYRGSALSSRSKGCTCRCRKTRPSYGSRSIRLLYQSRLVWPSVRGVRARSRSATQERRFLRLT